MAETTMAPADLAPAKSPLPVGYRFRPTNQQLVGHYLHHKLKADDLSIHDTIPEIGVCKYEPWDLLARAASASATKFDESECFFFSPRDYKYSNSNRSNRTTLRGFWKVTGKDRKITGKDTNKVIGTKKTLVYHEGRVLHGIKTNWVIHEYHDAQLSSDERTHVLCWLRKDNKKKTKEKTHQLIEDERKTINDMMSEYETQVNICMNSRGHYFSNRSSMIQAPSQSNEAIDSMIQIPFELNEPIDSMIQTPSQSSEPIDSMIQVRFESFEAIDSIIQTPSQSSEPIDSMIQVPFESFEAIDSMIQTPSQSSEAIDSLIQVPFESFEAIDSIIQTPSQSSEPIDSMIQVPSESFEAIDSMIQTPSESFEAIDSMIQTPSQSSEPIDSIIQVPFESFEAIDSMIQTPSQLSEAIDSMIQVPFESHEVIDSMIQTSIKPAIQANETITSVIHIVPPEPNSFVETSFDAGEFGSSLFDFSEFDFNSLLQSPRIDEQGLF